MKKRFEIITKSIYVVHDNKIGMDIDRFIQHSGNSDANKQAEKCKEEFEKEWGDTYE